MSEFDKIQKSREHWTETQSLTSSHFLTYKFAASFFFKERIHVQEIHRNILEIRSNPYWITFSFPKLCFIPPPLSISLYSHFTLTLNNFTRSCFPFDWSPFLLLWPQESKIATVHLQYHIYCKEKHIHLWFNMITLPVFSVFYKQGFISITMRPASPPL